MIIYRSEYFSASTKPVNVAKLNRIRSAMLVPFELFFLDTIDTIPPQSMHILTTSPALPLDCPLSSSALARPAIILWNATNTLNTMEMIPLTNFQVFIIKKSPFLSIFIA